MAGACLGASFVGFRLVVFWSCLMGFVVFALLIALLVAFVRCVVGGIESFLVSVLVKDEDDMEALRFVIGCIEAKLSGSPMPEKPSYIGAGAAPSSSGSKQTH